MSNSPYAPPLCAPPNLNGTIVVWEPRPTRFQLINRLIVECGGQACHVEKFSAFQQVDSHERCNLAIIALEACLPYDEIGLVRFARPPHAGQTCADFFASLPHILAGEDFRKVVERPFATADQG